MNDNHAVLQLMVVKCGKLNLCYNFIIHD